MTAATTVTISVTQEHIDDGKPEECGSCPIALAILATIPGACRVAVYDDHANVWVPAGKGRSITLDLPPEAGAFVLDFDAGEPVSPFTFTAEVNSL